MILGQGLSLFWPQLTENFKVSLHLQVIQWSQKQGTHFVPHSICSFKHIFSHCSKVSINVLLLALPITTLPGKGARFWWDPREQTQWVLSRNVPCKKSLGFVLSRQWPKHQVHPSNICWMKLFKEQWEKKEGREGEREEKMGNLQCPLLSLPRRNPR